MEEACSLVQTIIAGQSSNLTESLATRLPNVRVLSARAIVASEGSLLPKRPYRLVINSFQPASRLRDLSQPRAYVDQAIGATARLLEDVDPRHCLKVLYTSSASVYGDAVNCSEAMLVSARDLHSGLKVANEQLVRGVCAARGIDATIARLFNLYGGRDTFSVVA
jgi:nucleoside-diphosphate-sugar epimerase